MPEFGMDEIFGDFENIEGPGEIEQLRKDLDNQNRRRKLRKQQDKLNEVGKSLPPGPEILAMIDMYDDDWCLMHQEVYPNSTGLKPFGEVQIDSIKRSQHFFRHGGRMLKVEPRGYAKTSRSVNEVLWATFRGLVNYTAIVASSLPKASQIFEGIKGEAVWNEKLYLMFPDIVSCFQHLDEKPQRGRYQTYEGEPTHIKMEADQIVFPCIEGSRSAGAIIGIYTKDNLRGIAKRVKYGPNKGKVLRPQIILLDDIQTDEEAENPRTSNKIVITLKKSALFTGTHAKRVGVLMNATPIKDGDVTTHFMYNEPSFEVVRYQMLKTLPVNLSLWLNDYSQILLNFNKAVLGDRTRAQLDALAFYTQNRERMDEGAEPTWEWAYGWDEDPQTEISATQHAMNILIELGREAFECECQCNPKAGAEDNTELRIPAHEIAERINRFDEFICPLNTKYIVTHIDVNKEILTSLTIASPEIIEPHIITYDTFPQQLGATWEKSKIFVPMHKLFPEYNPNDPLDLEALIYICLTAFVDIKLKQKFKREDGLEMSHNLILIDTGYNTAVVKKVIREAENRNLLKGARGLYVDEKDKPIIERSYSDQAAKKFPNCVLLPSEDRLIEVLFVDIHWYKTELHKGLKGKMGLPGAVSLFKPKHSGQHLLLGQHCESEKPEVREHPETKRKVVIWTNQHRDNEFSDNMIGAAAGLVSLGAQFKYQGIRRSSQTYDINSFIRKKK